VNIRYCSAWNIIGRYGRGFSIREATNADVPCIFIDRLFITIYNDKSTFESHLT
jgi:hypothetical protein